MKKAQILFFSFVLLFIAQCDPPVNELPPPEQQFGTLAITSEPAATAVLIDGKEVATATPFTTTLPTGNHAIELRRQFYKNFSATIGIATDKELRLDAILVSIFFPYAGTWVSQGLITLPSGENIAITMELEVADDIIFGTDTFLIGDFSGGDGNCVGQINSASQADILCSFGHQDSGYWRSVRYQITPKSNDKILIQTLFVDANHRSLFSVTLNRKN